MKNRFTKSHYATVILSILLSLSGTFGQAEDKEATTPKKYEIAALRLYDLDNSGAIKKHYLIVRLTSPQDNVLAIQQTDLDPSNVIIRFLPSGRIIPANLLNDRPSGDASRPNTKNTGSGDNYKVIQIGLSDDPLARPDAAADGTLDDKVEVTFKVLHFEGVADPQTNVSGTGAIFGPGNIKSLKETTLKELQDAVAQAKTTEEKNFFTDFNVVLPTKGGDAEGSADIIFNRNLPNFLSLFDQVNFGFKLKKATENKSDPRHFELGLTFRKTFLFADRTKLKSIRTVINSPNPTVQESEDATRDILALQDDFVRAILFDSAIKFEADASNRGISNVSNLLYDGNLQIATVSRRFGKTGLFNFRFLPAGVEIGSNLTNNDDPSLEKRSLTRFKIGGEVNLIFRSNNPRDFFSRITLSGRGLNRYLFRTENIFDEATQKVTAVGKGNKYWLQSDLKVITGIATGFGRVGFKVTYSNGSLPPVYSVVKSFKFGLVFETNDDDNSENIQP